MTPPRDEHDGLFPLDPASVRRFFFRCIGVFAVADLIVNASRFVFGHDNLFGFVRLLDMKQEQNIPTWFSIMLLSLCALVLVVVGEAARRHAEKAMLWPWRILAAGFVYLALDELLGFHERFMKPMKNLVGNTGILRMTWVVAAVPVLIVLVVLFVPFLRALPKRFAKLFLIAGAIYIGGAVVMEAISGWYAVTIGDGKPTEGFALISTVEETMEMLGPALFISYLLEYLRDVIGVRGLGLAPRAAFVGKLAVGD
jgi:hypothetical protein